MEMQRVNKIKEKFANVLLQETNIIFIPNFLKALLENGVGEGQGKHIGEGRMRI